MSEQPSSIEESKTWSRVAGGWRLWWSTFESAAQAVNDRLCELARIEDGARVLDICCGIGEPAVTASRHAQGVRVLAADFADEMLANARRRAVENQRSNIDFARADAQRLPLQGGVIDAAVSRWGIMLVPDPWTAARELARVLKPGATLAFAVWGEPAEVPFLSIGGRVLRRELNLEAPDLDAPGPFRFGRPGSAARLLADCGFEEVDEQELTIRFAFASPEEFTAMLGDLSVSMTTTLAEHPAETRERVWQAIRREVEGSGEGAGVALDNIVRIAAGRRPR